MPERHPRSASRGLLAALGRRVRARGVADVQSAAPATPPDTPPATPPAPHALDELLAASSGTVAVLVGPTDHGTFDTLRQHHRHLRLERLDTTVDADKLHLQLTDRGPFAVVVDDVRAPRRRLPLLRTAWWHLVPGGTYVLLAGARLLPDGRSAPVVQALREVVDRAQPPQQPGDEPSRAELDDLELQRSVGDLRVVADDLVLTRVGRSWPKVTEAQADRLLASGRRVQGRVLRTLPGAVVAPRCEVGESPSYRAGRLPSTLTAPPPTLREYDGAVCAPGQLTISEGVLLPDTFRHVVRRRLSNRWVLDHARRAGAPLDDVEPSRHLEGACFQLDSEFRGHFGHALTEQLSRVWGWQEAKERHPDLRALVATNAERTGIAPFELDLLAAVGIPERDVVLIDGPTRVDTLVAATPMFGNPTYVHPALPAVWSRAGAALEAAAAGRGPTPARVFCSRRREHRAPGTFSGARRVCHNGDEVEALFVEHGFEVIYPEDLDLPQQARLFRHAEVVAGYAGSAMFNLVFADTPKHVISITSESYTAKNEYLIAAAAGHRLDVAWCRADIAMTTWNTTAFNSSFTFDPAREGTWLRREVLDRLGTG